MRTFVLVALAAVGAATSARADILYGATGTGSGTGTLVRINPADGSFVVVGAINDIGGANYRVTGLAFDPNTGVLYGSTGNTSPTAPRSLITIDPATGLATLVGGYGAGNQTMADITFRPNGTLYGWLEPSTDDLYTINTTTGAATLVGDSGLSTYGSGLASDAAGTLYFAGTGTDSDLRTIDPVTGLPTTVAILSAGVNSGDPISAMAFDSSGVLFGVEGTFETSAYLVSIDTVSGAITLRGQSIDRLDAIVFAPTTAAVPEPASITTAVAGAVGLFGLARRRKAGTA